MCRIYPMDSYTPIGIYIYLQVVSVSKTPGHTKHFQTIFLTSKVKLCDSPGLVFPSLVPKPMQILAGIYPIAQVREPYTAVGFLAQRIPLQRILRISHPDLEDQVDKSKDMKWSAYDVCIGEYPGNRKGCLQF